MKLEEIKRILDSEIDMFNDFQRERSFQVVREIYELIRTKNITYPEGYNLYNILDNKTCDNELSYEIRY